jgi:hypothetical protein
MKRGDRRVFAAIAGVAAAVGVILVLQRYWDGIASIYERELMPERYWTREVEVRAAAVNSGRLRYHACLADLLAVKMKEPLLVEEHMRAGVGEAYAKKWAAEKTAAKVRSCRTLGEALKSDQGSLAEAQVEHSRLRSPAAAK